MTFKVIEINDIGIKVSDEHELVLTSPGYAHIEKKEIEFGYDAKDQSRLNPTSSFNQFWHLLNLEPLPHPVAHYRHFADIAYSHLICLAQQASVSDDIVLAVPGSYGNQELGILLGLVKQCPFNVIGIVDIAVVAAVKSVSARSAIHIDLQLHQVVLTKLNLHDGVLSRDSVVQIPATGLNNFYDHMTELVTDLFISQCRYNPQHNAHSEQQIFDKLPGWLGENEDQHSSLLLEVENDGVVHQAKLPRGNLIASQAAFYKRIIQQIDTLSADDSYDLLLSSRLSELPGFSDSLANSEIIPANAVAENCFELAGSIVSAGQGLTLCSQLALPHDKTQGVDLRVPDHDNGSITSVRPTHLLVNDNAFSLANGIKLSSLRTDNAQSVTISGDKLPDQLGWIEKTANELILHCVESGASVNDIQVSGTRNLRLGDCISFSRSRDSIKLIRVSNG